MFTARKDHSAVTITSTLKSFSRSRTVTFIYASDRTRHVWDVSRGDSDGHCVVGIEVEVEERIRGGSVRGFALHRNRALEKETTFIYRCLINKTN